MEVYALHVNGQYVGFGFSSDVEQDTAGYDKSILTVIDIASTPDETTARNLTDYFTHLINQPPYKPMTEFGITADDQYTLTARAQADFDVQVS